MTDEELQKLSREELLKVIKVLGRNWITLDGLWFTGVEDEFGMEAAVKLDERMWSKQAGIEARRMREALGISEKGPPGVARAYSMLTPCWADAFLPEFSGTPDRLRVRINHCNAQEAREKLGRPRFPCKVVGLSHFNSIIRAVDQEVEVKCLVCPPDPLHGSYWCEWELTLKPSCP
ncbi:MAG: DUF6125 family protein [Dehalococcoidia bacterium]|nr:DUF6125 family protein [Dehalococcoidia bacterium]